MRGIAVYKSEQRTMFQYSTSKPLLVFLEGGSVKIKCQQNMFYGSGVYNHGDFTSRRKGTSRLSVTQLSDILLRRTLVMDQAARASISLPDGTCLF